MNDPQQILAIDPAARTGFAHTNGERGVWDLRKGDFRVLDLYEALDRAVSEWGADSFACEDASFGAGPGQLATMAMHNELRGIIKLVAAMREIPVIFYKPASIKKFATGNGRADKQQMMRACKTILGFEPEDDNVADAAWILELATRGYVPPATQARKIKDGERAAKKKAPKLWDKPK